MEFRDQYARMRRALLVLSQQFGISSEPVRHTIVPATRVSFKKTIGIRTTIAVER